MWISAFFFFCHLAFASPESEALSQSKVIAENIVWQRLLHLRGATSDAEGLFLSKEQTAEAEARATIHAFFTDKQSLCRFPARRKFLQVNFGLKGLPEFRCPEFESWRNTIHATGVELLFASAFVNSPSSMYGHTMLKFPRGGKTAGNSLLDYTLSFGADTGTSAGLSYMINGLTGAFRGYFATAPFYLKVLEYTQVENRDFWIYPLKLSPESVDFLIAHVWELKNVGFRYYFLRKNCAYFLLELLEVVLPNQDFVSHFPLWSVPMDTIRILRKADLLLAPSFRASRFETMNLARSRLNAEEMMKAKELVDNAASSANAASPASVQAAYEYFRYRYGSSPESDEKITIQKKLLSALSTFPQLSPIIVPQPKAPDEGHLSSRAFVAGGLNRKNTIFDFGYRGTLHDLLDDPVGYEDSSELTMGDFHGRVESGSVFLEHSDILRIRSVPPRDSWVSRTSWTIRLGTDRAKDLNCSAWHCLYGALEGGPGATISFWDTKLFLLAVAESDFGASFSKHYRMGIGPTLGWTLDPIATWRILFQGDRRFDFLGESQGLARFTSEQSWILRSNLELRLRAEIERGYREAMAGIYVLF